MAKRGGWFSAVKKIFSCESKANREKKSRKSGKWFGKQRSVDTENAGVVPSSNEEVKLIEAENEQNRYAYSVAIATAVAAEAAVAAAHAAAEVVRLTATPRSLGKTKEEIAAIKIQTAFRGYMARRALRALRGLVRLKSLLGGQSIKRQATNTLKCMQTLGRVQLEIRSRRIKRSEDSLAIQRQIQQKREKELENLRECTGENWDDSAQSKEKIVANLQNRKEAAIRRERALAYAYSHQQTWRNSSNPGNQTFMDPNNPRWGWNWLERWIDGQSWENTSATNKEPNGDKNSVKSSIRTQSPKSQKQTRHSPSTPNSKIARKMRPPSPKGNTVNDEDSKSLNSIQSERCRRHSIASSSVRDDESLVSSPAAPGYMTPTESARARSRLASPLGLVETPDKLSGGGSAKKRLSFSGSPAGLRRHSGPPKIDIGLIKNETAVS